jgi:hypothetical protein
VPVVVEHFLEGPLVDDGLLALEAGAVLSLEGLDGDRTKLDSRHR